MTRLLTPEQQTELVIKELLEPLRRDKTTPPVLLSWLEENLPRFVVDALQQIGRGNAYARQQRSAQSQQGKRKLSRLLTSARQARQLRANFDALEPEHKLWVAAEVVALPDNSPTLDRIILKTEMLLGARPARRKRPRQGGAVITDRAREAAREAHWFFFVCGQEPTQKRMEVLTEILVGDLEANVRNHVSALLKKAPAIALPLPWDHPARTGIKQTARRAAETAIKQTLSDSCLPGSPQKSVMPREAPESGAIREHGGNAQDETINDGTDARRTRRGRPRPRSK
jgi:hypothetical protein